MILIIVILLAVIAATLLLGPGAILDALCYLFVGVVTLAAFLLLCGVSFAVLYGVGAL